MDPTYQSLMVQQLMGAANAAPGTTGQLASTPYGQGFITGNMSVPSQPGNSGVNGGMGSMTTPGMLAQSPNGSSQQLMQPMATYQ